MLDEPADVDLPQGLERLSRDSLHNPSTQLTAMTVMLLSLPRPTNLMDAIAVPTCGMGEPERVAQGVSKYNHYPDVPFLLMAGAHPMEIEFEPMTPELLVDKYGLDRDLTGVRTQERAFNTVYQTDWWAEQVALIGLDGVAVMVPPYHALRLVCTLIASLKKRSDVPKIPGSDLPAVMVVPLPVMVPPGTVSPEPNLRMWDLVPGELERMAIYQAKGDVISYEEFLAYMAWLWRQPEISGSMHI